MGIWLGFEGWCLEIEQRPGPKHAQQGFVPLLLRAIRKTRELTEAPLLVCLNSAHDALVALVALKEANADFNIKWNRRNNDMLIKATEVFAHGKLLEDSKTERIAVMTETVERNYQDEKGETRTIKLRRVLAATERWLDKDGPLLTLDIEVEGWWTSLTCKKEELMEL